MLVGYVYVLGVMSECELGSVGMCIGVSVCVACACIRVGWGVPVGVCSQVPSGHFSPLGLAIHSLTLFCLPSLLLLESYLWKRIFLMPHFRSCPVNGLTQENEEF